MGYFYLPFMFSPIKHRTGHSLHPCAATTAWKPESSASHAGPRLARLLLRVLQDHTTSYREPWWSCLWGHLPLNPWLWFLRCTADTRYSHLSNISHYKHQLQNVNVVFCRSTFCLSGFDSLAAARIFLKLMERLGFSKFYLQGGDWGSLITTNMAQMKPQ